MAVGSFESQYLGTTQAHLASRCYPGWGVLKRFADLKSSLRPGRLPCRILTLGFISRWLWDFVHRLRRRGRLLKAFKHF